MNALHIPVAVLNSAGEDVRANVSQKFFPRFGYAVVSPLADCLRPDVADARNCNSSTEQINDVAVSSVLHIFIVSILAVKGKHAIYKLA